MLIHAGYEISYACPQPTPMILTLSVHPSRINDLVSLDRVQFDPPLAANTYHDSFGNFCHVIKAPAGRLTMHTDFVIRDSGQPDPLAPDAPQHELDELPVDVLMFLLGSRYCETDRLSNIAWSLFGHTPKGWPRVQAICDFVHNHITFNYAHASPLKTAFDAYTQRRGVCRDFAHLAVTLCRCMNIPARYCTGYLGDIGVPPDPAPMDFSAWFEAYLGGRWYTFDARHNSPRIGRILMARGRDATDVAIVTSFGLSTLSSFKVVTAETA
ncbi:transglutaminase-like domain-containing protein [Xanthobacter agilis]|jgi:transglutaminase-like putative cysteine protease|uniref:Transglutaminase-like putative cysteine protease n=1 Tax=Xanthobacter agilis TaxID=47492 RepID=A0ABU0LAI5_XANAG|nr:transglutaminase family protein [Xanthobacter agilis]MDQ0504131.1 transglutaminase-like putative cysteine protease [Xanthobacter agilis]